VSGFRRNAAVTGLTVADLDLDVAGATVAIGPEVRSSAFAIWRRQRARLDEAYHACQVEGVPINSVFPALSLEGVISTDAHYAARLFFDANGVREESRDRA
jgi:hypothetical protein